MDAIDLLASDNYITVNKDLIKIVGLESAVILGELCSEYRYWRKEDKLEDDMFYCTIENLEENTGLSEYIQRKAIKNLEQLGILKIVTRGLPARRYFKIITEQLLEILRTSSLKIKELDTEKLKPNNNNKKTINKNNTISKDIVENFNFGTKTKKPKTNLFTKCVNVIDDFTNNSVLRNNLIRFLTILIDNSKESGKPFYTNQFIGKLNKLKTYDERLWNAIVVQTLDNGWLSFYDLQQDNKNKSATKRIEQLNTSHTMLDNTEIKRKLKEDISNGNGTQF